MKIFLIPLVIFCINSQCPNDIYCGECKDTSCIRCFAAYIGNDGKCIAIAESNLIDYCISYESENTCRDCVTGYYVSNDKKACMECDSSCGDCENVNGTPKCSWCEDNRRIVDGKCPEDQDELNCTNNCKYCH